MEFKRIVVLANSYKKKPGRCVAGREMCQGNIIGSWIRPISDRPEGELLPRHIVLSNRSALEVPDVVDVPLDHYRKDESHPEDWVIDAAIPWKRHERFPSKNLVTLEEQPRDLWMDPATRTDRATEDFLLKRHKHQSLYLIRPTNFRVELSNDHNPFEGRNQPKRRACFVYRNQDFSLGLTDPSFIERYAGRFPSPDQPAIVTRPPFGDNCLLCVSLTPLFNGYHYKIVATVLELP